VALQYDDFDLQIRPLPGGKYRVHVNAPSGQTSGDFLLPFTDIDFGNFLGRIGQVRRGTRRSDGPELNAAKDFGGKLFNAVFSGEMIAQLRSSVEQSLDRDHGLRIRLRLTDAPELADLPWEFLYDAAQNHFLTTSIETPVVRFLDLPQKITPLRVSLPLRVLVMIAGPRNPSAGAASTNAAATPLRVNATEQEAKIENRVSPVYPAQAAQNHISGMVVLDVVVAKDGTVKNVAVTSGDPALTGSAVDAVKQRHYAPTLVNGLPVEVETTVSINYAIKDSPSPAVNGVNGGGDAANSAGQQAPCTLGSVTFKENGTMIIGTVPYAYSGNAKLATLAVVGFPVGSDKKRIAGVALAETTLPAAIGTAPFSMESRPSLNGGGATGEFVEVVVIVKSTGEALCGKLVPYLRNW
jgi:TonB family protein